MFATFVLDDIVCPLIDVVCKLIFRTRHPQLATSKGYTQTTTPPFHSGQPGCRNFRAGGDSANPPSMASDECWYATYVVYRSFKHPPPIPKVSATPVARAGG